MKVRGIYGSIEARGKFGDVMVAFPWKDIQVIRVLKYPAQPRTAAQVAQRLKMANAIAEFHASLFTEGDIAALRRSAGLRPKGETGPNQMTRDFIRVVSIPETWPRLRAGRTNPLAGFDRRLIIEGDAGLTNLKVRYGTNISYMYWYEMCAWDAADGFWTNDIPLGRFNSGDRVYFQFFVSPAAFDVNTGNTGIYYFDMP